MTRNSYALFALYVVIGLQEVIDSTSLNRIRENLLRPFPCNRHLRETFRRQLRWSASLFRVGYPVQRMKMIAH